MKRAPSSAALEVSKLESLSLLATSLWDAYCEGRQGEDPEPKRRKEDFFDMEDSVEELKRGLKLSKPVVIRGA